MSSSRHACLGSGLLIALLSTASQGQGFHAVVFTTGATTMSVDALNGVLTTARFSGLSNDGISYGANGYVALGRALLGVDVAKTTYGEEGTSSGRSDDLNAMQFLGTASYNLVATKRMNLFPTLGVGVGRIDITLRDRSGGAAVTTSQPTFAEVAANPGASSVVAGNHLLYSVGGGADFLITRGTGSPAGVVFGVRGGYLIAPNRTTWSTDGRPVLTGPDASAGGPFVRVVVGLGVR
ncbi:MAG: hypothetical protein V4550_12630 [Gemmatimonadota bacterium]